ncbi:MAG: AMP-binding protein [Rhodobacteraceae bacterium]|nr:AMP-binding protein [Paracoccaceae bacterium]
MTSPDYDTFYNDFSPAQIEHDLQGNMIDGINACVECCDRYIGQNRIALNCEDADGNETTLTFDELQRQAARFANILTKHGIGRGDRVAGLLPRIPELLIVILGTLRAGAVYQPLFTAFGSKAITDRLAGSEAKLIVTDTDNRPKLDTVANCPITLTLNGGQSGDIDFASALAEQPDTFDPVMLQGDDLFLMMFTSGTTGPAKGVGVPLKALLSFASYMKYGLDLRPEDRFWNIADPGWAYGLYYAVIGPLLIGHSTMFYQGQFEVDQIYELIAKHDITNFAGAPTAYRMIIAAGEHEASRIKGRLRVASSAGEPLNPEVMRWFGDHLDCPLYDHYGQTEVGMVLMNHHGLPHDVVPGTAGRPMPGYDLAVLDDTDNECPVGEPGTLAVNRLRSPLFFFPGYKGREGQGWNQDYYLTGDSSVKNPDGSYSFVGRSDDLIKASGYRIGPFDVESCLIENEAVLESAVIGKPDAERGQIVRAFVVLRDGFTPSDDLAKKLQQKVRERLGTHAYPREITFLKELPKTPSGKIQRFVLRNEP